MNIEIFELKYLQFIFSNLWTFLGFVILLLILTDGLRKVLSKANVIINGFISDIKARYKRIMLEENLTEKLKSKLPIGLKE